MLAKAIKKLDDLKAKQSGKTVYMEGTEKGSEVLESLDMLDKVMMPGFNPFAP